MFGGVELRRQSARGSVGRDTDQRSVCTHLAGAPDRLVAQLGAGGGRVGLEAQELVLKGVKGGLSKGDSGSGVRAWC